MKHAAEVREERPDLATPFVKLCTLLTLFDRRYRQLERVIHSKNHYCMMLLVAADRVMLVNLK